MIVARSHSARCRLLGIAYIAVVVLGGVWLAVVGAAPASAALSGQVEGPQTADPAQAAAWVVNSALDAADSSPGNGVCATSTNVCTLRAALTEANARLGADTITFAIPATGPQTIQLGENLPALADTTGGTTIDGYTQPGAAPNTDPLASNAKIMIQLRGHGLDSFQGLHLVSSNNTIRGLALFNFKRALHVAVEPTTGEAPAANNRIIGNFIGINAAGESPYTTRGVEEDAFGIHVRNGATNTLIGSPAPADRNVVSGNAHDGIFVIDIGTDGTRIVNNIVGLDPSGKRRVRNWGDAIDLNFGVQNTVIGGLQPGERNVISGNQGEGIEISHNTTTRANFVMGNFIGTDLAGKNSAPSVTLNTGFGISLEDKASGNTIGPDNIIANNGTGGIYVSGIADNPTPGLVPGALAEPQAEVADRNRITSNSIGLDVDGAPARNGFLPGVSGDGIWLNTNTQRAVVEGNEIAYNTGAGVRIVGPTTDFNRVSRNTFRSNGGLAIDIGAAGVNGTAECSGEGPNQCVRAPVFTRLQAGRAVGTACPGCSVEVYLTSRSGDASGEGEVYLLVVRADSTGLWEAAVPASAQNRVLTATATDRSGNTSEFSLNAPSPIYLPVVMRSRS